MKKSGMHFFGKITNSYVKLFSLVALLVLALAVPATLTLINQSQDLRKSAQTAGSCRVHLAVPPKEFATDIDTNPNSGKTKENYHKQFNLGDLRNPNDGGYTTEDLLRPYKLSSGEPYGTTCSLNNHPINIDQAKCGTSWYYSWAQCSPSGSWRPVFPHGPLRKATNSEGAQACVGSRDTMESNILVHFRNRLAYVKGNTVPGSDDARWKWNYIMAEVKSGMTTFGQMYSYKDDLNYAAQQLFGKSFNDLISQEKSGNCSMDSWSSVCRTTSSSTSHVNPVRCTSGATCSISGTTRTHMCSNYTSTGFFPEPFPEESTPTTCSTTSVPNPGGTGACDVNLAIPPKSFATDIDSQANSGKTKENYHKQFDKGDVRNPNDGGYTTLDLEKPPASDDSTSGKNCYLNNHPINIEEAKCGTSWYYSWAACSPGGSWRPVTPHGPLRKAENSEHSFACIGARDPLKTNILVHFRNRIEYTMGSKEKGSREARGIWNRIMAEVKTGYTTFGQMYSYEDDLEYASQRIMGKSYQALITDEKAKNCAMDSWGHVCRSESGTDNINPVQCSSGATCSNDGPNRTYLCSDYKAGQNESTGGSNTCVPTTVEKVLKGKFDFAKCDATGQKDVVRGWACHPGYKRPIDVHLWAGLPSEGGIQIATVKANLDRKNPLVSDFYGNLGTEIEDALIQNECDGQEEIGWAAPIPLSIKNGKTYKLYAYAVDPINLNKTLLLPFYYSSGNPSSTEPFSVACTNTNVIFPSLPAVKPTPTLGPSITPGLSGTPGATLACKIHLAVPPKSFATDINADPKAFKTKENYWKKWDIEAKQYSSEDLTRPIGMRDGKVDPTYCYINNHPINIDGAKCGTSWYFAWTQCSPGGSWRPTAPHGPLHDGSSHDGAKSCTGEWGVIDREYLVHFRNRAMYIKKNNLATKYGQWYGRRAQWNYLMGEVRSGNTTFAQMYTYEEDLNWLANEYFGMSFNQLIALEKANNCSMDSWNYVCAFDVDKDDINPVKHTPGATCQNHQLPNLSMTNPPLMVFSDYRSVAGSFPDPLGTQQISTQQSASELTLSDYNTLTRCMNQSPTCDDAQKLASDINGDGVVDQVDLSLFIAKF